MAEPIQMKSKALEIYDHRKVDISRFITGFTLDEAQLQKDLDRVLRRYGRKEAARRVSEGDTVVLSCRSDAPKYQKENLTVPVGKGLFSRALEEQLIGLEADTEYTLSVEGQPVSLRISRITHTVLPELTDENVAAFGMEGVSTLAELRRWCIGRQVEGFLLEDENPDEAAAYVWQEVARRSRIQRDPEELALVSARADAKVKALPDMGEEGMDPEQLRQIFLYELDLAAVGAALMERDGKCLTSEDYEAYVARLKEACPEQTEAQLRQTHSQMDFAMEEYADYLAQTIDRYVASCFRDVLTRE